VATVVVCSDEFGPLGRAEAEVLGLAGLPLVGIPHPVAGNRRDLVAAKARAVADEVVDALTADAAGLAGRYRARFTRLTQKRLPHGVVCVDEVCAMDPALGSVAGG
jgi:hypothetical protein